MEHRNETTELLLAQYARYPALLPQDLFKALYQSIFGCGHLVADASAAADFIRTEAAGAAPVSGALIEPLGSAFCRVHLDYLRKSGLTPETLARLFSLSAETTAGNQEALTEALRILLSLSENGQLPFSPTEVRSQISAWQERGYPACRHTDAFRAAYAPAYRVLRQDYAWALPLFAAIDKALCEKKRLLIAIEGGAAAGKSTLGTLLTQVYDCNLFHMDDFFLRPEQRTPERYACPGGNIDHERFLAEVLEPLQRGDVVQYRRFDCSTFTVLPPVEIAPKPLNIVEGAYSCHPALVDYYDLTVFLNITPELQAQRIRKRNTPAMQQQFFSQWLPLERTYFETFDTQRRCDITLEVSP